METALIVILPIVTGGLTIASFFIARSVDAHRKGHKDGAREMDQAYMKEEIASIVNNLNTITQSLNEHFERIIRTEESAKAAHRRLDDLMNK